MTVSGFKATAGFSGTLNPSTEDKTITIEAFGDADSSSLPEEPTVEPEGAITFTKKTLDDGSVVYEIQSINTTTAECTISFGQGIDIDPITVNVVSKDISVNIGGEDIEAVATDDGKAAIDLSGVIGEDDEIAVIKDKDGNPIYDVNNQDGTEDGYTYDSDDKTLTVDVSKVTGDDLAFTAETVKVLLYDAELAINGREYTRPELSDSDLKGKYSKPSDAWNAINGETLTNGIYIQLLSDIEEDSIGGKNYITINQETTIDLSGHSWSKVDPKNSASRIIAAIVPGGKTLNVINGELMNGSLPGDYLGAAIYANNTVANALIQDWLAGNKSAWGIVNIFDVAFSDNKSGGGGAICLNGAVELNVYDAEFIGNDTTQNNQKDETGNGAAIYVWNHGNDRDGEIVNLYDCSFSGNKGNGLLSMENNNNEILFNIYGGSFTGNTFRYDYPLMAIYSFNIYGGDFSGETISNDKGFNYDININGGIMGTLEISGNNLLKLAGGSVGTLQTDKDTGKVLASVTLSEAEKVEYVTYGEDGVVNINSPFNINDSGAIVYKYEAGYSSNPADVFNGSVFNPAITEFGVFLPENQIESIENITVHFADDTSVTLEKTTDGNTVKFS